MNNASIAQIVHALQQRRLERVAEAVESVLRGCVDLRPLTRFELSRMIESLRLHDLERAASHLERAVGSAWSDLGTKMKAAILKEAKLLRRGDLSLLAAHVARAHRTPAPLSLGSTG